ncbi:conserved hypothetical protein [uncultured Dysgonomonas sp.]|uniref:Polymer-forming cytoskeletal protein n=1 Tax=uncultured Dysgonomonas sp. TaxID=206096 RepID=A0A212JJW8_9BACT|nr:polymer-forming cytoskeletal protein [uncultured Dysgonomonas sp.]SBV99714.1 conserved hypothetical protein [uncultured Dysgonomonas sp.]
MFLFKRKIDELEPEPARIVELGRDVIILGSLYLTEGQEKNFYVDDTLTVDINTHIVGNITATHCIVDGKVTGNIICAESLELGPTAVIEGTITAKAALINAGCVVNGEVVLDPLLEVPILSIKIAEAKEYLEKEGSKISVDSFSKIEEEILQKDSRAFNNIPSNEPKSPIIQDRKTDTKPKEESDNWW